VLSLGPPLSVASRASLWIVFFTMTQNQSRTVAVVEHADADSRQSHGKAPDDANGRDQPAKLAPRDGSLYRPWAKTRQPCILIPCLNEERTICGVIEEYRDEFPGARIVVVDNGSVDSTAMLAREAGAEVLIENRRGKAQAVLAALPFIEDELMIMVDGDGTYPAAGARLLVDRYRHEPCDMLIGIRRAVDDDAPTFRPMHEFGTRAFAKILGMVFAHRAGDIFSGLRLFSKRFYKNVPVLSRGFELEMELTIQCIDKGFRMAEVETPFRERPVGSSSKLNTVRDGLRIFRLLLVLFRDYRPLNFFGSLALVLAILGSCAGSFPILEYLDVGQVQRFPLAILAAGLMNLAFLTGLTGVMLESGLRHRREGFQLQLRQFDGDQALWTLRAAAAAG